MQSSSPHFHDTPPLAHPHVGLAPLGMQHTEELADAVRVGELWRAWYTNIPSPEGMSAEIERRLGLQAAGELAPWAIINPESGRAVGMSTYMNLDPANRRLEIGSTWLGKEAQGTLINPAAKLLMLTRAFEELSCIAVEFRTHFHNRQSRAAIAKLGAKQDGVLRNHALHPGGETRDTVVFSVIDREWPTVKLGLLERIARGSQHSL